jgi:hypothetical protein
MSAKLSPQKEMVRVFYKELWDRADKSFIPMLFHADFTFRGSLGPTLVGHEGFAGYVDLVTSTFGSYTTTSPIAIRCSTDRFASDWDLRNFIGHRSRTSLAALVSRDNRQ